MRRLEQYGTTYRPYYERYLCHSWNITHEAQKQLKSLEVYYTREKNLPNYHVSQPKKDLLLRYTCE